MAVVKTKLGQMPCPCCGHLLMVRENAAGTKTASCDGCDISMFAKAGTEAARRWAAAIVPLAGTVPKEPAQTPASTPPAAVTAAPPAPVPAPVPKSKAGPFDFLHKGVA